MNASELRLITDEELEQLSLDVRHEQELRRTPEVMAVLNQNYLTAEGAEPGQEWRQPMGPANSYPVDWEVTWNGKTWASTTPFNVWEPGVANWREVVPEGAPPPEWVRPSGSEDGYALGDRVTFEGQVWESTFNGVNVWSPTEYPQGWKLITE